MGIKTTAMRVCAALSLACLAAGCSNQAQLGRKCQNAGRQLPVGTRTVVNHVFDLAQQMPAHLSIMFSMSWFGIPGTDPETPGPDPSYGNYAWGGGCVALNNPRTCSMDATPGEEARVTASRRRMMAGIYSVSGRDQTSLDRTDLMLSTLHRSCDDGAALDAWSVQMGGLQFSSLHPSNPQTTNADLPYRALQTFLGEADKNGLNNVILAGNDSTWYFHFGNSFGLGKCDDSPNNPKQTCIDALKNDFTDLVSILAQHPSAYRLNGKLLFYVYVDNQYLSAQQWAALIAAARTASGQDFYVLGSGMDPAYFAAFDALAPWVNLGVWPTNTSNTLSQDAKAWVTAEHAGLLGGVGRYPGRVVFGGASPGFDDYTQDWGACQQRKLPPAPYAPRDPTLLDAQFDYFLAQGINAMVFETWDDWTEGSHVEPDMDGGTSVLLHVRDRLRQLYGEAADPAGDTALNARWVNFGQPYNCCFAGGACPMAGVVPALACPQTTASTSAGTTGTTVGSTGRTSSGSGVTSAGSTGSSSSSTTTGTAAGGTTGGSTSGGATTGGVIEDCVP